MLSEALLAARVFPAILHQNIVSSLKFTQHGLREGGREEGGRKEGREGERRERGKERGREGRKEEEGREGGKEGWREGETEGRRKMVFLMYVNCFLKAPLVYSPFFFLIHSIYVRMSC